MYLLKKSLQHPTLIGSAHSWFITFARIQGNVAALIVVNHIECCLTRIGGPVDKLGVSLECETSEIV